MSCHYPSCMMGGGGCDYEAECDKERNEMQSRSELDQLKSQLDCGDNSCHFAKDKSGMRTNGGCRCFSNAGFPRSLIASATELLPRFLAERDARLKAESACAEMRAALEFYAKEDHDKGLIAGDFSPALNFSFLTAGKKVLRDMAAMRAALENIVTSLVPYAPNSDEGIAVAQAKQALADLESTK